MWEQSQDLKLLLVVLKLVEATEVVVELVFGMEVPEPAVFVGLRMHKMEVGVEEKTELKL